MLHSRITRSSHWIALSIGNTHWKWGYFLGSTLLKTYRSKAVNLSPHEQGDWESYCRAFQICRDHHAEGRAPFPKIALASVVPEQTQLWRNYPKLRQIHLPDIPIKGLYATCGIDRALALLGAGKYYGWPCLVIDAGTALTFSGADAGQTFQGGAIAPGITTQLKSLNQQTGALPLISRAKQKPSRWAKNTNDAILSGVLNGIIATTSDFCHDWSQSFANSQIIFTGGDGEQLLHCLQEELSKKSPINLLQNHQFDADLIFRGISTLVIPEEKRSEN